MALPHQIGRLFNWATKPGPHDHSSDRWNWDLFWCMDFENSPDVRGWMLEFSRIALARFLVLSCALSLSFLAASTSAQVPPHIPPPGISVPETDRQELMVDAAALEKEIIGLAAQFRTNAHDLALLPDIEIFHKAVDWALRYNEFFESKQIGFAKTLL